MYMHQYLFAHSYICACSYFLLIFLCIHGTRFCQRIIPVMKVCHATLEDIRKQATEVLEPHFYGDDTCAIKVSAYSCQMTCQLVHTYVDECKLYN